MVIKTLTGSAQSFYGRANWQQKGRKICKCDLLGMQIYSIRSQKTLRAGGSWKVDSRELSTTNDPLLRLWHRGDKYDTPGWEICKYRHVYKSEVICFGGCPYIWNLAQFAFCLCQCFTFKLQTLVIRDRVRELVSACDRKDVSLLFNYRINPSSTWPLWCANCELQLPVTMLSCV